MNQNKEEMDYQRKEEPRTRKGNMKISSINPINQNLSQINRKEREEKRTIKSKDEN